MEVSLNEIDLTREAHTWLFNCIVDITNASTNLVQNG